VFIAKSKAQPDAQYTRNEGKREEERGDREEMRTFQFSLDSNR
jgi:hypothetical protein